VKTDEFQNDESGEEGRRGADEEVDSDVHNAYGQRVAMGCGGRGMHEDCSTAFVGCGGLIIAGPRGSF
jgi:hypothetical protein